MEDRIRSSFAKQGMMRTFAASMTDIAKGAVTLTAPITPQTGQQQGYAHAALTFGLGDSAAGYAALTLQDAEHEIVTAEMAIHLLAPATGDRLIARGEVVKPGRRLIVVTSKIYAEDGGQSRQVALMTGTMVPVRK